MFPRGIIFFEVISDLKVSKVLNLNLKPHLVNEQEFNMMRANMIHHLAGLKGLSKSIYLLPASELSRACSTFALQCILDILMMRKCVVSKIVIEVSLNVLLLISFYGKFPNAFA